MKLFRWFVIYLWYEAFVNNRVYDKRIFELIESFYNLSSEYLIYYITSKQ